MYDNCACVIFFPRVSLVYSHCKIFALQNFNYLKRETNDILTQWDLIVNTFIG